MAATKGLIPTKRKLANSKTAVANQWQNTPKQLQFMKNWLDPQSPTFGNTYQSGIMAGYSENYANQMSAIGLKWLTGFNRKSRLELEHLEAKLIDMINNTPNSKSPDDTKVKAIELYAKITGKLESKNVVNVNFVQPILGGKSVKKVEAKEVD